MTTLTADPAAPPVPLTPRQSDLTPAEVRGATSIADRVVEKIAAQAVAEVDCATGATRRVLGMGLGSASHTTPARVHAQVDGNLVTVEVSMSVVWPASVRSVTREVRRHVTDRVHELTGLRVAEVDIAVPTLVAAVTDTRSRVS
jgi:uncharacterized alkaline shock family protein YloU